MVYTSVFDFRFNHIPLTRHTPFSFGAGQAGAGGFETAVFTHAGGWGHEEAFGGAPFDAAHGLRGQVSRFHTGVHGYGHGHRHGHGHGTGGQRHGDVEHNAGRMPMGAGTGRDTEMTHPGPVAGGNDGRDHHSRSIERKALPGWPVSGEY